jgi:hypothetical protein
MVSLRHIASVLGLFGGVGASLVLGAPAAESWPDRAWLVRSLVNEVPAILKTQDPETGRFGGEPWTCTDQNAIFPLAAAWAIEDAGNPYHHSEPVLRAVCQGGDVLVAAQDAEGMWTFRRKDNTTWGRIHMPWTYSRWVRAYALVRDAMPPASREAWAKGLQRGFRSIRRHLDEPVQYIAVHHAMALYIAGQCLDNRDWQEDATRFMAKAIAAQDTAGFWPENCGPTVGHSMACIEALGIYYSASHDSSVLDALERGARFHAAMLWPDGTPIAAVDERQVDRRERSLGNVGFSYTPAGRGLLLSLTRPLREQGRNVSADFAANMLVHGGHGEGRDTGLRGEQGQYVLGDRKALVLRRQPWQLCLSAYCAPVPRNRWLQDRQNFVDVFIEGLGLVIGGGNTKLQPYWSTFTAGDPSQVRHRPGDPNPEFSPFTDTRWVPTRATLHPDPARPALELAYHNHVGRVTAEFPEPETLQLTYEAVSLADQPFTAHVPFLRRQGRVRFASGQSLYLTDEPVVLSGAQVGGWFEWDGIRVDLPAASILRWPALQHNPYAKDGAGPLANARLVLVLPLSADLRRHAVTVRRARHDTPGRVYEARQLPVVSKTDTHIRSLDDLASLLLGASRPGDSMTFTLAVDATGAYELLADFVLFPRYGIVQVSVDGTPAGTPFDAYAPEFDVSGPVSIGEVLLTAGRHELALTVTGRNPRAEGYLVSVRTFRLRRVPEEDRPPAPGTR